ncbi:hypothetical protein RI367_007467 [Sorochytrium milnesiophthora]
MASDSQPPPPPLTFTSYLALVLFLAASFFTLRPLRCGNLPLPGRSDKHGQRWLPLALSLVTAPPLAVVILLAARVLDGPAIKRGILGVPGGVEPYAALTLVLCLAYLCLALDLSGALESVSWSVAQRAVRFKRGGKKVLFVALFVLSACLTAVFSNDAVVMTLTPVVARMAHAMKMDTAPYVLGTAYLVTNVASMALYTGNPANILAAQAHHLTFPSYAAVALLPTLVACTTLLIGLVIIYRHRVDMSDEPVDAPDVKVDRPRAIAALSLLLAALVTLSLGNVFASNTPVWVWTLPFALVGCAVDIVLGVLRARARRLDYLRARSSDDDDDQDTNTSKWQYISAALRKLPWALIPYLLGMFCLVEALDATGWTARLTWLLTALSPNPSLSILSTAVVTALLCPIVNNLPATGLVLRALPPDTPAAAWGVVLGANLGGNLGQTASLAALLFRDVLRRLEGQDVKVKIPHRDWIGWGAVLTLAGIAAGAGVLIAELHAGWLK